MFKKEIENRLIYSKKNIVGLVETQNILNFKWVCIYPINKDNYQFKVLVLELPKTYIAEDMDWFEEDEITQEYYFENFDELMIFLYEKGYKPEIFSYPWDSDYPYP